MMMAIAESIVLAGVTVVLAGLIIGGVWKVGIDMGDVKSGVNELLGRERAHQQARGHHRTAAE